MSNTTAGQRRRATRKPIDKRVVRVELKDGMGNPRWVTADLVDSSESGIAIVLMTPLRKGSTIIVHGTFGDDRVVARRRVEVKWCVEGAKGAFRAGLEFMDGESDPASRSEAAAPIDPAEVDCYEVLQLSPNADLETIHRVYRMLAQRYHPDNSETGDPERFVQLCEVYQILSDPQRRAGYDARHRQAKQLHWQIFDQAQAPAGREAEKRKRQGILELLYAKALHDPERADMTIHEFERLLGCPREHLDAALWYLKGKNYIQRSDNGRYTITIQGFEQAEEQSLLAGFIHRQLSAPREGT